MKQIKILLLLALVSGACNAFAQQVSRSDVSKIALSIWIPDDTELTADAQKMLYNKVSQIASRQGIAADPGYSRFIFTANVIVVDKFITPTAPPKHAYKMDVTFYIGDGFDGKTFASYNTSVTGVGDNETKAFMDALKNIKVANPDYKTFIEQGKAKIIAYYNERCDAIIREAQALSSTQKHDEAIYKLMSVPEECSACYPKAMNAVAIIYQQKIDRECKMYLAEATTLWNAEQDAEGAQKAGEILIRIDPNAACFSEVRTLSQKISERIKALDNRAWNAQQKAIESTERLERERIRAYRDVQKAYAQNQPAVKYVIFW
jgi:hypothetical protein